MRYLIDNSQSVFGRSQAFFPRSNRGLAVSPDGRYLYAGYIKSKRSDQSMMENRSSRSSKGTRTPVESTATYDTEDGELRKIDTTVDDYTDATLAILPDVRPKAIAVDSEGQVYVANGSAITIYDADLTTELFSIPTSVCEGVAVVKSTSGVTIYGTERYQNTLKRWELVCSKGQFGEVKQTGFENGSGEIHIPDARSLRSVAVDGKGRIWMADLEGNQVFRVEPTGKDLKVLRLDTPCAIAFDGPKAYVTQWRARQVTILDEEMNVMGSLVPPWDDLEMSMLGNRHNGAFTGIVAIPGQGFYVSNEQGQTANQRSTYGRVDEAADVIKGKLYTDAGVDDNDPIFRVVSTDAPVNAPADAATPAPAVPADAAAVPAPKL